MERAAARAAAEAAAVALAAVVDAREQLSGHLTEVHRVCQTTPEDSIETDNCMA